MTQKPVDSPEPYEYFLRGRRLYRRGTETDMQAAVGMFEKSIELKPTFALAYAGLGQVYGRMHRFYDQNPMWMEKGTEACGQAIKLELDLPEALSARAFLFYSHEQYEMSVRYARMALERKEDCEGGYYALGLSLFLLDRLQEVAALADRAIEVSGDDYNTYLPYIYLHQNGRKGEGKTVTPQAGSSSAMADRVGRRQCAGPDFTRRELCQSG